MTAQQQIEDPTAAFADELRASVERANFSDTPLGPFRAGRARASPQALKMAEKEMEPYWK
jgi:hypothetical protein